MRIKQFADFINEHRSTEEMSSDDIKKLKEIAAKSGDVQRYVGKELQVTKLMRNLSGESSPWVERVSDTEVKVYGTPDEDARHEILDIIDFCGLIPFDANSATNEGESKIIKRGDKVIENPELEGFGFKGKIGSVKSVKQHDGYKSYVVQFGNEEQEYHTGQRGRKDEIVKAVSSQPYMIANKLAKKLFGEFGLSTLKTDELDKIIDLKAADKIADKEFGEFGFQTCDEEDQKTILNQNPKLLKK